ncbi:chemotaxis protein CheB [Chelativorans salis]|uniref:Blue-light-activated histidine kinase n=1 Tax=Chelativorans salis TaxID=2978478 RepID=A0ABT2LUV8_9HYPH|nr:chemotaxis protein CheB [Chelativorans sp. EGI FJ00035]MCT7378294.1 PAS domain-containing protein [Chelativorans sp. EGI FJ00035]
MSKPPGGAARGGGKAAAPAAAKASGKRKSAEFPVVGIGASAGGIEALIKLFDVMPADISMAFVIVLHLDPTHESQLAHLLGQHTEMPVAEISDGMSIEPDHVYVIAPDSSLTVERGRLRLKEPAEPRGHRHPVDVLFDSLANDQQERAICIVLSGTGRNGTEGLKEVKMQGGCVLVQDPETARFDGMPRSAITANLADQILAPEHMPEFLLRYIRHAYIAAPHAIDESTDGGELPLDPILALLRLRCGHDFRHYKRTTLLRRVHRRMGLANLEAVDDYTDLLRSNPAEIAALVKDLMISVTRFFRDPEAWETLDKTVLAPLVAERDSDAPIRLWAPGCATGEEAYSLAMLLTERAEAAQKQFQIKIFATDSQDDNLNLARAGVYPEAAVSAIPPDRLRRFFDKLDGSYEIKKELRDLVVFAPHNLLRDAPFSRIDLITCRNLLIYIEPEMQKRVLALLHFGLREAGYLFLGSAETVGAHDDLFETVSKKWRIFRRLGPTRHDIVDFPLLPGPTRPAKVEGANAPAGEQPPARLAPRLADVAQRALLDRFAPASVLVDRNGRALWFHGPTGDFLAPPTGEPTHDLLAMARDGMTAKLRGAMRQAASDNQAVAFDAWIRHGGTRRAVAVAVAPVSDPKAQDGLLLVSFRSEEPPQASPAAPQDGGKEGSGAERALEDELKATRAELKNTVEQMEGANEELKASNEEITSMNEELQSTNEELETSKEELQSFNEELHTVNNQLQHKNQELEETTDHLNNLLTGTDLATVFLDTDLRIKWFSPASMDLLDLVASDIGRPVSHFTLKVADEALLRDAKIVLEKLIRCDAEVQGDAGRWYLRRLIPYRTHDNRIAGVVATFTDITARKQAADAADEARIYAQAIVETVRHPLLVLDGDLRVQSVNPAFVEAFGCPREESEGALLHDLDHGAWDIPELRRLLNDILSQNDAFDGFGVDHVFPRLGRRHMLLNARKLSRDGDRLELILLAIEDITERKQAEAHRETLIGELSHRVKNTLAMVQSIASQTLRRSSSLDEFRPAFEGRVHALARAHDLLVDEDWTGAEIGQLALRTLEPYRMGDRVVLDGPRLLLSPQTGVALVMILHELATNAVKYGALSNHDGRLQVSWRLDNGENGQRVRLKWVETGGPPVNPPSHKGFGTSLIERSASHELGGDTKVEFREDGFLCEVSFPRRDAPPPRSDTG